MTNKAVFGENHGEIAAERSNRGPAGELPGLAVAIIGAGISGLSAAHALHGSGVLVQVYDRGRHVGGRVSSRSIASDSSIDFGAPCFEASNSTFARHVEAWESAGVVSRWHGLAATVCGETTASAKSAPRFCDFGYVGTPSMRAVAECLALHIDVRTESEVLRVHRHNHRWRLYGVGKKLLGEAPFLVVAMPSEQADRLLHPYTEVSAQIAAIESSARWVVLLSYEEPLSLSADRLEFEGHEALKTAWHESAKPGRAGQHWVLHARTNWSSDRLDVAPAEVAADLSRVFSKSVGGLPEPVAARAHRWRYSQPRSSFDAECVWAPDLSLAVCGDWCRDGGVQGAFLGGVAAAKRILEFNRLRRAARAGRES